MPRPTRIEQLDAQFPGLADQVRSWFNHGISAERVALLLREVYGVQVPAPTVANFRARRWAKEVRRRLAERIAAEAARDFGWLVQARRAARRDPSRISQ